MVELEDADPREWMSLATREPVREPGGCGEHASGEEKEDINGI